MKRTVVILLALLLGPWPLRAQEPQAPEEPDDLVPVAWIPLVQVGLPPLQQEILNCNTGFEESGCWYEVQGLYSQIECENGPGLKAATAPEGGAYRGRCYLWQGGYENAWDQVNSTLFLIPEWANRVVVTLAWNISSDEEPGAYDYDTCSLVGYIEDIAAAWEVFTHGNTDETPWWNPWLTSTYVLAGAGEYRGQQMHLEFNAVHDETDVTSCKYDEVRVWAYSR